MIISHEVNIDTTTLTNLIAQYISQMTGTVVPLNPRDLFVTVIDDRGIRMSDVVIKEINVSWESECSLAETPTGPVVISGRPAQLPNETI